MVNLVWGTVAVEKTPLESVLPTLNPSTHKSRPTDSPLSEALRGRPRALGRCRSAARPRTRPRGIVEAVRQPITNYGTRTHVHDSWWGPSHHALRCHLVHR